VVLKNDQTASEADLKAHMQAYVDQGHLSRFGIPDRICFRSSLLRTSVGKLNKRGMREALSERGDA
jgi:fatty-acyl-CoA synthase